MTFTLAASLVVVIDAQLDEALAAFARAVPNIAIWKRWPEVDAAEDRLTDTWACESVSREFAEFLIRRGFDAQVICAEDSEHPLHDHHRWVRVRHLGATVDVDWTARQFYDLEWPPNEAHRAIPCPLVWRATDHHPVSGRYRLLTTPCPKA